MSDGSPAPFAEVEPESVSPGTVDAAELRAALAADTAVVRQRGVRAAAALAGRDADAARPFVDDLIDRLDDESLAVARFAATALVPVSEEYPDDFAGSLDPVVTLAESDLGGIRGLGASILGNVVVDRPADCRPYLDRLLAVLNDAEGTLSQSDLQFEFSDEQSIDTGTRKALAKQNEEEAQMRIAAMGILANVVVAIAEADPESVRDDLDEVAVLLAHDDPTVAGAALDVFCEVAQVDPDATTAHVDAVADCLGHVDASVRAKAIQTLGFAGDPSVVPRLREVAAEDEDDDVRDLAAETADFLVE